MERCLHCGSPEIRVEIRDSIETHGLDCGPYEHCSEDLFHCEECGAVEAQLAEFPELDQLDEMLAWYEEVPIGEPPPDLEALRAAPESTHHPALTARQQEIARLVACGLPNKEIAWRLGISEQTAKNHVRMIFERLGVRNRTHLALLVQSNCAGAHNQPIEPERAGASPLRAVQLREVS